MSWGCTLSAVKLVINFCVVEVMLSISRSSPEAGVMSFRLIKVGFPGDLEMAIFALMIGSFVDAPTNFVSS